MTHLPKSLAWSTAALLVLGPAAAPAYAEGPGYAGNADRLSVAWKVQDRAVSAAGREVRGADGTRLVVTGLGFRAASSVRVRVGDHGRTTVRVDDVGQVSVSLPAHLTPDSPGATVLALGRAPSGTTRTLVGAVPPRPSGRGPVDLAPWAAGLLAAAVGVVGLVRRRSGRVEAVADAADRAQVALLTG